jgi:hypothetical protein
MGSKTWSGVAVMSGVVTAVLVFAPSTARAEFYSDAFDGAVCTPYPMSGTGASIPYQHWRYGFGQMAFCHFPVPNGWTVNQLSYVLLEGTSPGDFTPVRMRLCVSSFSSFAVACGPEATLTGSAGLNWVAMPGPQSNAATAFVSISFPSGVSTIQHFYPVFFR